MRYLAVMCLAELVNERVIWIYMDKSNEQKLRILMRKIREGALVDVYE